MIIYISNMIIIIINILGDTYIISIIKHSEAAVMKQIKQNNHCDYIRWRKGGSGGVSAAACGTRRSQNTD